MKLDVPDEYVPLIVTALENYHAYTPAIQREDARHQEAAEWFKQRRSPALKSGNRGQGDAVVKSMPRAFSARQAFGYGRSLESGQASRLALL